MKVNLELDRNMRIIANNNRGHETIFDTTEKVGGENTAATPMEVTLETLAGCSFMDVISILRKKRKQVDNLEIEIEGERRDQHPKIFTKAHLKYKLTSPDAELKDLERAIELSQDKYCGVSAMFKLAGCEVTWEAEIA
tara:strand:+ start:440 stop:853 length:414 start_codon:yes stop_codon:yes gene_type:complete